MVKMVSLKKTAAEKKADKDALGEQAISSVPDEDMGVTCTRHSIQAPKLSESPFD